MVTILQVIFGGWIVLMLVFFVMWIFKSINDSAEREERERQQKKINDFYDRWTTKSKIAIDELKSLIRFTRTFKDWEKDEYLEKYKMLYNGIVRDSIFTSLRNKNRNEAVFLFVESYDKIDDLQRNNHLEFSKYYEVVKNVEYYADILTQYQMLYVPNYFIRRLESKFPDFEYAKKCIYAYIKESGNYMSEEDKHKLIHFAESSLPLLFDKEKLYKWVKDHNTMIINFDLRAYGEYFRNLFEYPLDKQQSEAIITDEDNTLVIASAGSGKTSTIIGKVNYLVDELDVRPEEILVVTYTRKAAAELRERMGVEGVSCVTFNSHALATIGQITGRKPDIADGNLLSTIFNSILNTDDDYLKAANKYSTVLVDRAKENDEYESAQQRVADLQKNSLMSPYPDMDGNRMYLKSKQEKIISIILSELGVSFRYEEAYEHDTTSAYKRQYRPDFVIHYDVNEIDDEGNEVVRHKRLYFEHFGVGVDGNVPKWFGDGVDGGWYSANAKYKAGMNWKIALHREYNTSLIYTTSADFATKQDIQAYIISLLEQHHVPINILSEQQKRARMKEIDERLDDSLSQLISGFITLMKANQYDLQSLINKQSESSDENAERNSFMLEHLVKPVYEKYQAELKRRNQIDFTDSLLLAAQLCTQKNPYLYKYILVDEFQDMSLDKYAYLKALRSDTEDCFTRLFCVGDDWQSIYRFSGSDMTLFYNFADYFGVTAECKIETTHRFGEPLLSTSSKFILANPEQKSKSVATTSGSTNIKLLGQKDSETKDVIRSIIKGIPEDESVYVLGRYKVGVSVLAPKGKTLEYDANATYEIEGRRVKYLTVHSAKGLEADNVIVINCDNGAFPSTIEDDPMLELVLSGADSFEYAEERRLFYVAITRAKKCSYVLYDYENPSPFIQELGEYRKAANCTDIQCPRCKSGYVRILKDAIAKDGRRYISVNCTNGCCDYFENLFEDNIYKYIRREVKIYIEKENMWFEQRRPEPDLTPYWITILPKERVVVLKRLESDEKIIAYISKEIDISRFERMDGPELRRSFWEGQYLFGKIGDEDGMTVLVPASHKEQFGIWFDAACSDLSPWGMEYILGRKTSILITPDDMQNFQKLLCNL